MKSAVLKAGLANKDYRKKQEMRLIFKCGTISPSGLKSLFVNHFLLTRTPARAISCGKRASAQSRTRANHNALFNGI